MLKILNNGFIIGGKAKDVFKFIEILAQLKKDEYIDMILDTRIIEEIETGDYNLRLS